MLQTDREYALSTLATYLTFRAGWDGEGSVPPSADDTARACRLITALPEGFPAPVAMCSADGTLGLYWDNGIGYVDIQFDGNAVVSLFSRVRGESAIEKYLAVGDVETTPEFVLREIGSVLKQEGVVV